MNVNSIEKVKASVWSHWLIELEGSVKIYNSKQKFIGWLYTKNMRPMILLNK